MKYEFDGISFLCGRVQKEFEADSDEQAIEFIKREFVIDFYECFIIRLNGNGRKRTMIFKHYLSW